MAAIEGNHVTTFSRDSGLQVGNVETIHAGPLHVLVGGELGIARLDASRFRSIHASRMPVLNGVSGIVETAHGDVWVHGTHGVSFIPAAELTRALDRAEYVPAYELFDFRDGLPGVAQQGPVPSALPGRHGRLWLATNHGVAWIDPASIRRNRLIPPVIVQSITAGDMSYEPVAQLKLPQRTTSLRIDYTALSLMVPERVRFRYRLTGADDDWQDPGPRRQAFYTNLGPGPHRFQVIASNNDGVWNERGATIDFDIAPTFYQTGWFLGLCIATAVGLVWLALMWRIRQVAARIEDRLKARNAERERIARDLHDTLLQNTQAMILSFQAEAEHIPAGEPLRQRMESVLDRADQSLAEARDVVQELRTPDDGVQLPDSLAAAWKEFAQEPKPEFSLVVEDEPRALHSIVREESYRIAREALSNAIRHARATSIEVQVSYGDHHFVLRVRDNGVGVDPSVLEKGAHTGHWGITGMRERAQNMGARFSLWSRPGSGTEVELSVPASIAYPAAAQGHRFSGLGRLIFGGRGA